MTQFNIQRMKQYAQWQLATHRATLLKITGVATSAFILMFLFVKYVSHRDLQTQSDDLTLLWIGCFAFCGVQVFPNLLSKQERTSLLMLPPPMPRNSSPAISAFCSQPLSFPSSPSLWPTWCNGSSRS